MPTTRKTCCPKRNSVLAALLIAVLALGLAGCADDRALIDRTLDARNRALNAKDLDGYLKLIAPDYVKARPDYDPRAEMESLFSRMQSIQIQIFRREVQFEADDIARVVQEYKMVFTTSKGKIKRIKSADHFLLKRHGVGPFAKWLIYQGLDAPVKSDPDTPQKEEPIL